MKNTVTTAPVIESIGSQETELFPGLRYLEPSEPVVPREASSWMACYLLEPLLDEYSVRGNKFPNDYAVEVPSKYEKWPNAVLARWLGQTITSYGVGVGLYDLEKACEVTARSPAFIREVTADKYGCILAAEPEHTTAHSEDAAKGSLRVLDIPVISVSSARLSLLAHADLTVGRAVKQLLQTNTV
jgi:hypothetical protein